MAWRARKNSGITIVSEDSELGIKGELWQRELASANNAHFPIGVQFPECLASSQKKLPEGLASNLLLASVMSLCSRSLASLGEMSAPILGEDIAFSPNLETLRWKL